MCTKSITLQILQIIHVTKDLNNFLGYCAIDYSESSTATPDPFQLGDSTIATLQAGVNVSFEF